MPENSKISVSYFGYFTSFGGFGISNLNWCKYLKRVGVDVSVHAKFRPIPDSPEWNNLTQDERKLFGKPFEKRRIGIIETNPFDFDTIDTDIRIANTMCESDHVAPVWAQKLNSMDYIIVPNTFNRETFIRSGVDAKKISVISHGLDSTRFPYYNRPQKKTFTFGIVGYLDLHDRKGAFDLIRAFSSEFSEPDVRLLIKSSNPVFGYYKYFTDPRITVISNNITVPELNKLYRKMDCFVFPSKAEGVGYPPREAMSTGLPVILTDWSGLEDIAFPQISYPLTPIKLEPRYNFIEQDGNWAIIDPQELMGTMRHVYEHREEGKEKGKKAAEYIREYFNWTDCAKQMKSFISEI